MNALHDVSRFAGDVFVFYTCHYAIEAREWKIMEEFGSEYHPLGGYYTSNDINVLRRQTREMRRAGLDVMAYDTFATRQATLFDLPNDPSLPMLAELLDRQENESRKLKFCFYLEKYLTNPTIEEYDFALNYIRDNFADKPWYYRHDGKPLVLTYLNGDSRAINEVECRHHDFAMKRVRPYQSDVWSYIDFYPQLPHREWMPVSPGVDAYLELAYVAKYANKMENPDFAQIHRDAPRRPRENGRYYRQQLEWARQVDPRIIFVSGWNDWQYGLQIEPAVEYEYFYLDITAECLGRVAETAPYRDASPALTR